MPVSQPAGKTETDAFETAASARVSLNPMAGQPRMFAVQTFGAHFVDGSIENLNIHVPNGVAAVDPGVFWVTDSVTNKVILFKLGTTPLTGGIVFGNGTAGFADGSPGTASFNHPAGIAVGPDGTVYIADRGNNRIRTISPDLKTVSTLAGSGVAGFADGIGNVAKFNQPNGIGVDGNGVVYIADMGNNMIRRITSGNHVTRWCGQLTPGYKDDNGSLAAFASPTAIAVAPGGSVFVVDRANHRIRKIVAGTVTTFAGNGAIQRVDGTGLNASFNSPEGIAADSSNNLYIAESGSASVRMITPAGVVTTIIGGQGRGNDFGYDGFAHFAGPRSISVGRNGSIYMTDPGNGNVDSLAFDNASRIVVNGVPNISGVTSMAVAPDGTIYTNSSLGLLQKTNPATGVTMPIGSGLKPSSKMACDASGNVIAVSGTLLLRITPLGVVTTLASFPEKVDNACLDNAGNFYVTSVERGQTVFKVAPGGAVTRIVATQPIDFYVYGVANTGKAWFHFADPSWTTFTVDRGTGNFYVGYPEAVYRMTPDGSALSLVLGGALTNLPQTPIGSELLLPNGQPRSVADIFVDHTFLYTGLIAGPRGTLYLTNSGFETGFLAPNLIVRHNVLFWNPASPSFLGNEFLGNLITHDASGGDDDGSTSFAKIGTPYSPVLSADGKVLYFVTVTASGSVNIHKTSAL